MLVLFRAFTSKALSSKLLFPLPPHIPPTPSHHSPLLPDDQLHHILPLSFAPCRAPMHLHPRRSLRCLLLLPLAWELSDLFRGPIFSPILQQYLGVVLFKQQHLRHGQDPLDQTFISGGLKKYQLGQKQAGKLVGTSLWSPPVPHLHPTLHHPWLPGRVPHLHRRRRPRPLGLHRGETAPSSAG